MAITYTFLTSGTFGLTASKSCTIECYGAGGRGSKIGNGGSGGAYSKVIKTLNSGSYLVGVGQNDYNGYGNGGDTWFKSGSADVIICQAGGGRQDGTIDWQLVQATGSTKYYGGYGAADFMGYASYNGGGGGGGCWSNRKWWKRSKCVFLYRFISLQQVVWEIQRDKVEVDHTIMQDQALTELFPQKTEHSRVAVVEELMITVLQQKPLSGAGVCYVTVA